MISDEQRRSDSDLATGSIENRIAIEQIIPKNRSVLEVGCGNGHLSELIINKKNKLVGVDISPDAVDICESRFGKKAKFVKADILKFKPSTRFDYVFMNNVLDQIPQDFNALRRAFFLLKKTGVLVLSTPITKRRFIQASVHYYSESDIKQKITDAGFIIEKTVPYGSFLSYLAHIISSNMKLPIRLSTFLRSLPFYKGIISTEARIGLKKDLLIIIAHKPKA